MTNFDMRMVYDQAKSALRKAFPDVPNIAEICKLTQSDYRFEVPLVVGTTNYQFAVLVNQALNFVTEQRLKLQDSAVVFAMRVSVGAPSSAADNTFVPDTYANPVKYGANAVPLQAIWNAGYLSIAVNNDIVVPNWSVMKHYNAPETQQTAAIGAGSPGDQFRGDFDGFVAMEPNVVLIGSKDNVINIGLKGAGLTSIQANSRLIVEVKTIVAQNSTVVS